MNRDLFCSNVIHDSFSRTVTVLSVLVKFSFFDHVSHGLNQPFVKYMFLNRECFNVIFLGEGGGKAILVCNTNITLQKKQ